jgi:hypothetical protein
LVVSLIKQAIAIMGEIRMLSKSLQRLLAATAIAAVAITGTAFAEEAKDIKQAYIEAFGQHGNGTLLDNLARVFQQFDTDGKGITAESLSTVETMIISQRRAGYAGQWLIFDLNGDLRVTREEFEMMNSQRRFGGRKLSQNAERNLRMANELKKRVDSAFKSDLNGNGFIDGIELYEPQHQRERQFGNETSIIEFAKALLRSDRNGDGVLTQPEAFQLAADFLSGADEEIIATRERKQTNRALGITQECPQIDVSKDSQLILFGAYEATSLSNVTVAGQDDVTNGTSVYIEEGTQPLTLFLSSYEHMIWKFSGAVQRISKVVAFGRNGDNGQNDKPAVGVIGIDKSKLQFVNSKSCFGSFYEATSSEGLHAKAAVERMAGRAPNKILGKYAITVLALPSGTGLEAGDERQNLEVLKPLIEKSAAKFFTVGEKGALVPLDPKDQSGSHDHGLLRFSPFGIMNFNASEVVSEAKVEAYGVYPQHAGLMQLQAEGKITKQSGKWRINEAIRFPAGLSGALSTSYVLPKGVKLPEGEIGHGCLKYEDAAIKESRNAICISVNVDD